MQTSGGRELAGSGHEGGIKIGRFFTDVFYAQPLEFFSFVDIEVNVEIQLQKDILQTVKHKIIYWNC